MCEPQDRVWLLVSPTLEARLLLKIQASPFCVCVCVSVVMVRGVPSEDRGNWR